MKKLGYYDETIIDKIFLIIWSIIFVISLTFGFFMGGGYLEVLIFFCILSLLCIPLKKKQILKSKKIKILSVME